MVAASAGDGERESSPNIDVSRKREGALGCEAPAVTVLSVEVTRDNGNAM